jgi:hypothetical protein
MPSFADVSKNGSPPSSSANRWPSSNVTLATDEWNATVSDRAQ